MTISTTASRADYVGNGVTTAFPVTFPFFGVDELRVIERTISTGAEVELVRGTHYSVAGGGGATGAITATIAPAATVQWTILRNTARTQLTDYTPNDPFPAETHERALDRLTAIAQEVERDQARSVRVPATDTVSLVLPSSVERAGRFLGFDGSGNPVASTITAGGLVVTPYITTLLDDPDAATAQATLGGTVTGRAVFTAASQAAAQTALGVPPASAGVPAGAVMAFAQAAAPTGWLKANGAVVSRTTFAALFAAIGTTYNTGGEAGTDFRLPDLRAEFVRGWDDGRAVDTGRALGSAQAEAINTAGRQLREASATWAASGAFAGSSLAYFSNANIPAYGTNITVAGGSETRPRNVALLYCIKT